MCVERHIIIMYTIDDTPPGTEVTSVAGGEYIVDLR